MKQIYLVIVEKDGLSYFSNNIFCATDKETVVKCLNGGDYKSRVWLFPQLKEVTSADISLTVEA